jgi:hypothetical protein
LGKNSEPQLQPVGWAGGVVRKGAGIRSGLTTAFASSVSTQHGMTGCRAPNGLLKRIKATLCTTLLSKHLS